MSETRPLLDISPNDYLVKPGGPVAPSGIIPDDRLPEGSKRPLIFESLEIPRGSGTFKLKNRASVAPMCMYSSRDGFPTPFHLVHHGEFALRGFGSILVEASGVTPEGRISAQDLGIWKEEHVGAHASIVSTVKTLAPETYFGIQLAHAGRKASTRAPFDFHKYDKPYASESEGGFEKDVVGPSALAFADHHIVPQELTLEQIHQIEDAFVASAERAFRAGYDFVEVHSAHGYLLASFNSPLSNKRTDEYGGSFENRTRLLRTIVQRIRKQFPDKGLWVRINGTDAVEHTSEESWTLESAKQIAPLLEQDGVDALDLSSGGTVSYNRFKHAPGYQLPLAQGIKSLGLKRMKVSSVGALQDGTETEPTKCGLFAEKALQEHGADIATLGRGALKNPNWVELAALNLTGAAAQSALQYDYAIGSLSRYAFDVGKA